MPKNRYDNLWLTFGWLKCTHCGRVERPVDAVGGKGSGWDGKFCGGSLPTLYASDGTVSRPVCSGRFMRYPLWHGVPLTAAQEAEQGTTR